MQNPKHTPNKTTTMKKTSKTDSKETTSKTRQQHKEQIKAKILLASAQVFAAKGYEGASTREITRLADVNLANISYYFGGKEKLFFATIDATFAPVMAFVESLQKDALEQNTPPESVLKRFLDFMRDFFENAPFGSFSVYLISLHQPVKYVIETYSLRIFGFLRATIERAQREGIFRADVPSGYACVTFFSIFQSYIRHKNTLFSALPLQNEGDYFDMGFRIFLRGMEAK